MSLGMLDLFVKNRLCFFFLFLLVLLPGRVLGDNVLKVSSFSTCIANPEVSLNNVDIEYNQDSRNVTFNLSGTSAQSQNISGTIKVLALDKVVYTMDFNPCDPSKFIAQLCPIPKGTFSAAGSQEIPSSFTSLVPTEAFNIPDIPAQATLELKSLDTGKDVACVVSDLTNGKSVDSTIVSVVAAGIAAAALLLSAISAASAAAGGGDVAGTKSPGFSEVVHWFQGLAMNGMLSVNYPSVYRSFTKNFAFSTGIIQSTMLQSSIDSFRAKTGGNLTNNNVGFLLNATLVFDDSAPKNVAQGLRQRSIALADVIIQGRDIVSSLGFSQGNSTNGTATPGIAHVSGIQAYVEQLSVPGADSFMTLLIIISIVIAAIILGILLFKLILELWALFGSFPASLTGFRKHYWGTMLRTIVNLILLFQSIWILYCLFQFTHHDSWATTLLAGVTLALVMGVLIFYSVSIYLTAKKVRKIEGSSSALYDDKKLWLKYSIFYDAYKKSFWWFFIPGIIYAFSKGLIVAALDGHGMAQTIGLLAVEVLMFVALLWDRPYERRSGNIVNISIQVVRIISMVCILIFVNELGVQKSTQTILGFALVIVQSVVTAIIALLLVINAFIICCKKNPHRKRRKEAEKYRKSRGVSVMEPLHNQDHHMYPVSMLPPSDRLSYVNESKVPLTYEERHLSHSSTMGVPHTNDRLSYVHESSVPLTYRDRPLSYVDAERGGEYR